MALEEIRQALEQNNQVIKIEITDQVNEQVGAFSDLHEKRNFTSSPIKTGKEEKFDEKKEPDNNENSTIMREKN